MNQTKTIAAKAPATPAAGPSVILHQLSRRAVRSQLEKLRHGQLVLTDAEETTTFGVAVTGFAPATMRVVDKSFYTDLATGGDIAAAEAYVAEKWHTDDLTQLVRLFASNPEVLQGVEHGLAGFISPLLKLTHRLNRNTRRQSRKNIGAHYDLGNELFELFLDPTLSYSAAVYPSAESGLDEAATHKLDLVCQQLQLQPDDHLLEIGTGWGGLAAHAALHYGCRVTTTTISRNQHDYASRLIERLGLSDRVTLLEKDYRDLTGQYSKLVSIEMIEAVGHEYLDGYLQTCSKLLRPDGRALIQSILMTDRNFRRYQNSVDFIQTHIFPGGALPSLNSLLSSMSRTTDLQLTAYRDITDDYADTLKDWRSRFMDNVSGIRQLGYPEEFVRLWEYYFSYCEGGFRERVIATAQITLDKPGCRLPL